MSEPVTYEQEDGIVLITIANPPVNALSHSVRAGMLTAIQRFAVDDSADVAVILGSGRLFIGGADISEFGKPPEAPSLPDVIRAVETCDKLVIAAIHGTALGGGLEVALGAHYRIAQVDAKLGLPEVKLGLLPGAGGTQRLPRLIGVDQALTMITSGNPITAEQALEQSLVDCVESGSDIRQAGIDFARELQQQGASIRRTGELPRPMADTDLLRQWRGKLERSARGEVAALSALDAVDAATRMDLTEGLAEERRLFLALMETPQRAGLIHAFFAERKVAKLPELAGVEAMPIEHVGVIGGGTMGTGIATSALLSGLTVTLVEREQVAADKARSTIAGNLAAAIKRGNLQSEQRDAMLESRLSTVSDFNAIANADLIIEAVFESMEVKQSVFEMLDKVAKYGAIIATNTSYLDINAIAAMTARPEAVIGLHFFSPAHVMKLLEVVVADRTAPELVATTFKLAKRLGKIAVRAGVCDGFIGNRLLSHYRTSADHMLLDGASPYQIDKALTAYGFAMGPYAVADLAGLDIGYAARQRKAIDRHPRDRYPTWADELYHQERLGQKTGKGYYLYPEGSRKGVEDPEVEALISDIRQHAGITPRTFTDEEIVYRYMAAMVNEAARVLEEGIAQRPLDIDVVLLYGYGFPRWRGGPMHAADQRGLDTVLAGTTVNRFCASGLQAIAMGANMVSAEGAKAVLVGGVKSISMVQPPSRHSRETWIEAHKPELYLPMIETADIVAARYGISRESQDALSFESQQRTAAAQEAGRFDAEIAAMEVTMAVKDKQSGEITEQNHTIEQDECNRPSTTLEALARLEPVRGPDNFVTAGNASCIPPALPAHRKG